MVLSLQFQSIRYFVHHLDTHLNHLSFANDKAVHQRSYGETEAMQLL